ncbi:MAG: hypothetical protein OK456_07955 [Thaumarchaeota archaeon]|nr:hypothetical protein [Nitrososphaerota archaeon]
MKMRPTILAGSAAFGAFIAFYAFFRWSRVPLPANCSAYCVSQLRPESTLVVLSLAAALTIASLGGLLYTAIVSRRSGRVMPAYSK